MCTACDTGILNIRAGAIIMKDDRFLMVKNGSCDYYYSVGGRLQFGETAEEAVVREVYEETGVHMEIDHLGFIVENYFHGDMPVSFGKTVYEIAFYFYMKVPDDFHPVCTSLSSDGNEETLVWVKKDDPGKVYPEFFRTELNPKDSSLRHIVVDDRKKIGSTIEVTIDRPYGSAHPKYPGLIYPLNYGYVKDIYGGDGEYQDVYVLGVRQPLKTFKGKLIAIIHRLNDCEDKWVVSAGGMSFTKEEILQATAFQEQYFESVIEM